LGDLRPCDPAAGPECLLYRTVRCGLWPPPELAEHPGPAARARARRTGRLCGICATAWSLDGDGIHAVVRSEVTITGSAVTGAASLSRRPELSSEAPKQGRSVSREDRDWDAASSTCASADG